MSTDMNSALSPVDPNSPDLILRPKGHAIQGIDYGIDMLDPPVPGAPPAPSQVQPHAQAQVQAPPAVHAPAQVQPRHPPQPLQSLLSHDGYGNGNGRPTSRGNEYGNGHGNGHGYASSQYASSQYGYSQQNSNSAPPSPHTSMPGFDTFTARTDGALGGAGAGFVDGSFMDQMQPPPEMSYEEKRARKTDALAHLARLEQQGYVPAGKKGSHTTELSELEAMVEKLTAQRELDSSIKFQRKILIGFATLAESVCEHDEYNIFELDLQGWSESLYENITDYDEVFEELYLKYKTVAHIPPEIKLISMVVGSAWMYHMSRNMFGKAASKIPGFDDVMSFDPDLKKHYQQTATNLAQQRGFPVPDKKKDKTGFNFLGQLFGGGGAGLATSHETRQAAPPRPPRSTARPATRQPTKSDRPSTSRRRVPMDEPNDIDNLLGSLSPELEDDIELDLSEMEDISDLDA